MFVNLQSHYALINNDLIAKDLIEQVILKFGDSPSFTRVELFEFFRGYDPNLKDTTFRWRIHNLKVLKIIYALDKNRFTLKVKPSFQPVLENRQKDVYNRIHKEYPELKICIWTTKWVNEFILHLPGRSFTIFEVEKGAEELVFYFLQDNKIRNVYLNPSAEVFDKYVHQNPDSVVIKSLVTKTPLQELENISMPLLEKILVDLLVDPVLFQMFQGSELEFIYNSAFEKYHVNTTWMLNYASRRQKKVVLAQFLDRQIHTRKSE